MGQAYFTGWLWHDAKHIYTQQIGINVIMSYPKTELGYHSALMELPGICKVLQPSTNTALANLEIGRASCRERV